MKKNNSETKLDFEFCSGVFLCKILILRYVGKPTIDFYIKNDKLFILKILKDCRKK